MGAPMPGFKKKKASIVHQFLADHKNEYFLE